MIKSNLSWTIKVLKAMKDEKTTLDFNHPIQRQAGQWDGDKLKKSLLIHSVISGFPVPPIYCLKTPLDEKEYAYSVLDGKQRLTSIFDFIDGKYALNEDTPSTNIDGVEYELSNKYFVDLDLECQQELLRFKFTIYGFEDASDDLIEEIFYRLNNSSQLTKSQMSVPLMGINNATFVKSILSNKVFSQIFNFTTLQKRKSDDLCTLLQSMMLLDSKHNDYEFSSLSADEVMKYAEHIKNNYSALEKVRLQNIFDYLEKAFPEQEKMLKKINIPMIILAADTAMGSDFDSKKNIYRVGPMYFRQFFHFFFTECFEEYSQYCSSGSTKKDKTLKRIEVIERELIKYFELNESEDYSNGETDSIEETSSITDEILKDLEENPPEEVEKIELDNVV